MLMLISKVHKEVINNRRTGKAGQRDPLNKPGDLKQHTRSSSDPHVDNVTCGPHAVHGPINKE